jgi:hypothetical protein
MAVCDSASSWRIRHSSKQPSHSLSSHSCHRDIPPPSICLYSSLSPHIRVCIPSLPLLSIECMLVLPLPAKSPTPERVSISRCVHVTLGRSYICIVDDSDAATEFDSTLLVPSFAIVRTASSSWRQGWPAATIAAAAHALALRSRGRAAAASIEQWRSSVFLSNNVLLSCG